MTQDIWTPELERAFQEMRKQRGGEPFADAEREEAFQATKRRRYSATPSEEMRQMQLDEQQGR